MPKKKAGKKRRQRKPAAQRFHLAIRVDHYEVRSGISINHHVYGPAFEIGDIDIQPLIHFRTNLEIAGIATDPPERAGDRYELSVYTEDAPDAIIYWNLKDVQAVDRVGVRQTRKYRGKDIAVYRPPKGLGLLSKTRGEPLWTGAIFVQPRYVTDLLVLLGQGQELFMAIDETKKERQHWIDDFSLQTTDPAEE